MSNPPFTLSVVGSWPRPAWLLEALADRREGRMSQDAFNAIADEAALLAIKYQEDAGVEVLTDGEQRRDNFYSFVADKLQGVTLKTVAEIIDYVDDKVRYEEVLRALDVPAYSIRTPVAIGPVERRAPIAADETAFLKEHTKHRIKTTLPGPYLLTRASFVPGITTSTYKDKEELGVAIVRALRDEVRALTELGVDFIQFDEPALTETVYGAEGTSLTFMCAGLLARENPQEELEFAVRLVNDVVQGVSGPKLGVHVCRGNWSRKEDALLKGDYVPILPYLREMKVNQLVLEFATPRAGSLEVFREYPTPQEIGLGVVNPRGDEIETPAEIVSRAKEAVRYFDPAKVYLNPDCGFGTFAEAAVATPAVAYQKLRVMRQAAEQLRKEF
jgi:5-methyltetrahydropteroyltriglutamate--homocysteine methyltransferase